MDCEVPKLMPGAGLLAAHWRHRVSGYPLGGDRTNEIIGSTQTLHQTAHYRDGDVVIDVVENATPTSVAARTGLTEPACRSGSAIRRVGCCLGFHCMGTGAGR